MTLPLIPLLIAEQSAATAWRLGGAGLRELLTKDVVGRLLVILYNDYGEESGLTKRQFYAMADMSALRAELGLVVAGRRSESEEDIARLADLLATPLSSASRDPQLAARIAADAIAVAPFAIRQPQELARYVVAKIEELDLAVSQVGEDLLAGQARLTELQRSAASAQAEQAGSQAAEASRSLARLLHSSSNHAGQHFADTQLSHRVVLESHIFDDAILDYANWEEAELNNASFRRASLVGAVLSGCSFDNAAFRGASLVAARLTTCSACKANFDEAAMDNAVLSGIFTETHFGGAMLIRARLATAMLDGSTFASLPDHTTSLREASFTGSSALDLVDFSQTFAEGIRLDRITAYDTFFEGAYLGHANFDHSDLAGCFFRGAMFSQPNGQWPAQFVNTKFSRGLR